MIITFKLGIYYRELWVVIGNLLLHFFLSNPISTYNHWQVTKIIRYFQIIDSAQRLPSGTITKLRYKQNSLKFTIKYQGFQTSKEKTLKNIR